MDEIQKKNTSPVIGSFKPSPQLRSSLEEAKKCKEYFQQEKYTDYLISINNIYLNASGKINGPEISINSWVDEGALATEGEFLDLSSTAKGEASAYIDWEEGKLKKHIGITLSYSTQYDAFSLALNGSKKSKERRGTKFFVGKSIYRMFWLNPAQRMSKDIDDLLLTFTSELLDSGILSKI